MWPHEATLGPMKQVGLRELKNRLSEYVRLVRAGEHVQVTDRGQVVAELVPPTPANGLDPAAGLAAPSGASSTKTGVSADRLRRIERDSRLVVGGAGRPARGRGARPR